MSNLFKISLLIIVGVLFIASTGLAETWVVAQNGDPDIKPERIDVCVKSYDFKFDADAPSVKYSPDNLCKLARILGAPAIKGAGIYLHVLPHETAKKGDKMMTLYAPDQDRMDDAREFLKKHKMTVSNQQLIESA